MGTNLLQTKTDSLGTLNRIYLLALAYNLFYDVTKIIEELKKINLIIRLIYGNIQVFEYNPVCSHHSCFFKTLLCESFLAPH